MMMQKQKGFSAGGFVLMNLETFANVMKSAYNLITCLKNVI